MPFDHANHNSVLILNNCSVHHIDGLSDCGVVTHYLPSYSLDYNPIEVAFSKIKYAIKSMEAEMQVINDRENCFGCICYNNSYQLSTMDIEFFFLSSCIFVNIIEVSLTR